MRVLVVEDEPDLLASLAESLQEDGYAVDRSLDGKDGLAKALAWDYDLLVLDWMLPERSGIELIECLRKKKKTPVLLLTARDAISDRVRGLDAGADDYLVKPFHLAELLARTRALVRRGTGHASNLFRIGDIEVDTGSKCVTRSKVPIQLTAREYSLLELLLHHRGKLVTRTMIYDHILDENDDSLSNVVDVHMSHLRKKLGRDVIETRRGLGYILHG